MAGVSLLQSGPFGMTSALQHAPCWLALAQGDVPLLSLAVTAVLLPAGFIVLVFREHAFPRTERWHFVVFTAAWVVCLAVLH